MGSWGTRTGAGKSRGWCWWWVAVCGSAYPSWENPCFLGLKECWAHWCQPGGYCPPYGMVLCILMDMLLACAFFKKDRFPMFASLGCMSNQSFLVECNQGFGVLLFKGLFCFCVALAVNTFGSSMSFELSWDITSGVSCPWPGMEFIWIPLAQNLYNLDDSSSPGTWRSLIFNFQIVDLFWHASSMQPFKLDVCVSM
jgi:hypothetical protein